MSRKLKKYYLVVSVKIMTLFVILPAISLAVIRSDQISLETGESDYPTICIANDGSAWGVWQNYTDGNEYDWLFFSHYQAGTWSEPKPIPNVQGDLFKASCIMDQQGNLWIVWAQQTESDWDLWSTTYDGNQWSTPERLFKRAGTDFDQQIIKGPDGALLMVWQGWCESSFDILFSRYSNNRWSEPEFVTTDSGNDWAPAIAVAQSGDISVSWDSYRHGSYDVFLRQNMNGQWQEEKLIAASPHFEAHTSLACDDSGRVWVAYEERGKHWGKDQGKMAGWGKDKETVEHKVVGERLISFSKIRVRSLYQGELTKSQQPAEPLGNKNGIGGDRAPYLLFGNDGRLWMVYRKAITDWVKWSKDQPGVHLDLTWKNFAMHFDGQYWSEPISMNEPKSRIDSDVSSVVLPDGRLLSLFHTDHHYVDGHVFAESHENRIYTSLIPNPQTPVKQTVFVPADPNVSPEQRKRAKQEYAFVQRARQYRIHQNGQTYYLYRGDLHRHTDISYDGRADGSIDDLFRYAMDAGGLDFVAVTDHNHSPGPDVEYVWWRTQKITDLYNAPPFFISLFGYERSLVFPACHRNIIEPKRGNRPFFDEPPTHRGDAADTKALHDHVRKAGAITIRHTTGSGGGTDWTDHDPELDAVVEIYQGCRYSYEYEGAPKSDVYTYERTYSSNGYRPPGFLWKGWKKGLRFGVIASSDHGSTHISNANVYTTDRTRVGLVEAMRQRHTFASTDDIIIDFRTDAHLQGDDIGRGSLPTFNVKLSGTAPFREIVIFKNFHKVYRADSHDLDVEFQWTDDEPQPGENMYYVRVIQRNGETAWSSPIWIESE